MNKYITYKIFTQPFNPEFISNAIWKFDLTGLVEGEDHIRIFLPKNSMITETELVNELEYIKTEKLIKSFSIIKEILENKNWNELWEKGREVIRVTEKMVIKPSFKDYSPKIGETVLTIDPKMSFGTGEHQSTKLVLRLIEKYVFSGARVLDVGSGTGILSIAAVKSGAESAIAVDIDGICFENCKENCRINEVEKYVQIITGAVEDIKEKNFDLIFANIHKNVLLDIAQDSRDKLKKNGKLILAGLLMQDKKEIESKYHSLGFRNKERLQMDEWIALVFELRES